MRLDSSDQADGVLQESEAKFRGIVEYANVGIAILQDACFRFVNPHCAAMLGYTVDELLGTDFLDYCTPEERNRVADLYARRTRGEAVATRYETTVLHKNGGQIYVDVSAGIIPYDGRPAAFVFVRDITEQKQAKLALQEAYCALERQVEERKRELATLNAIAAEVNRTLAPKEIIASALEKTMQAIAMECGAAYRLDEADQTLKLLVRRGLSDSFVQAISQLSLDLVWTRRDICEDQPFIWQVADGYPPGELRDRLVEEELQSILGVPLLAKGQLVGSLFLCAHSPRTFTAEELFLLASIGHQVGIAMDNARLYEAERERREEAERLREQAGQTATIQERGRLARELHDSVTQSLYSVTMYTEAAARLLASGQEATAAGYLRDARDTAQEALREMRLMIYQLRPPILETGGLAVALQVRLDAVERRGGIQAELHIEGQDRLPPGIQVELHHIAQEALNNALKHAHAGHVRVCLHFDQETTRLEVQDDGVGFDAAAAQAGGGQGLPGMKERVQQIGGQLRIESMLGQGTTVVVEVPTGGEG